MSSLIYPYRLDEDNMSSDSAVQIASQQSIKAYVDNHERTFTVPDGVTVNTGGTPVGTVAGVQTLLDGSVYQVPEVTGTPGFDVEFDFSGITAIRGIAANFYYDGGALGHEVTIDIYDYDGTAWDSFLLVPSAATYSYRYIEFPNNSKYINSGAVLVRFYHGSAGNASHDLYVDYLAVLS